MQPPRLIPYTLLSVGAALATLVLKFAAYWLTDSVGLLSDALESGVNLLAATVATLSLWYASRPADPSHTYGHEKIEFFSSGLEGVLILVAACGIAWIAVPRLLVPTPVEALGLGGALALVASGINAVVAVILLRAGRRHQSIVLEADGKHLMTDVWTSVGVLVGLMLVGLTGQPWLDPAIALVLAGHIAWMAADLIQRSFDGLMDHALPADVVHRLRQHIRAELAPGTDFHALRSRQSGSRRFADLHLLVPGEASVRTAHNLATRIEASVLEAFAGLELTIHIEPIDEPASWHDSELLAAERAEQEAEQEAEQASARRAEER